MSNHQSCSLICLRYFLILLCISIIIIQVSEASNNDLLLSSQLSSVEGLNDQKLYRRNSKKLAQMLQQILRRGEMQVEPYRIHTVLGRLNRRRTSDKKSIISHNSST